MARGQTETLGMVLLLAITIAGVSVVVVAAGGALEDAQQTSAVERAEQSMSLVDARGSLVALGRTDGQSVSLADSSDGEYTVRPDTGRMVVTQDDGEGGSEEFLNTTLGSVVYENGDTEVAYQGGGVWRSSGAGAEMVSPPEFNYRDATLTLPVIRVTGETSTVAGASSVQLSQNEVGKSAFPTETNSNPLTGGNVTVSVYSEYYRGWEAYFEDRTTGNVTVYPEENRVDLQLIARKSEGSFNLDDMPQQVRGLSDEGDDPIESLAFTLEEKDNGPGFNTLQWSLVAEDGAERFEMYVGQAGACDPDRPVRITYENGGTTHEWENSSAFRESNSAFTYDCSGDNPILNYDFADDTNLSYSGADSPLSDNSTGHIVNHYLTEMGPDVELHVEKKSGRGKKGNSAGYDEELSIGTVEYDSSSTNVVTFLHVTENTMNVSVS